MDVMPAELARVGFARLNPMMRCHLLARFAKDAIRIQVVLEPLKASIIGWELALEVFERVSLHLRVFWFVLVRHSETLFLPTVRVTRDLPTVKG
jgi:hypothetical protein